MISRAGIGVGKSNGSPVMVGDGLDQSKAQTTARLAASAVDPFEQIENLMALPVGNSLAGVLDDQIDCLGPVEKANPDRNAGAAMHNRVANKVGQHLLHHVLVALEACSVRHRRAENRASGRSPLCQRREEFNRIFDQPAKVVHLHILARRACADPCNA